MKKSHNVIKLQFLLWITCKQEASLNSLCANFHLQQNVATICKRTRKANLQFTRKLAPTVTLIFHMDVREDHLVYPWKPDTLTTSISRQFSPVVRCWVSKGVSYKDSENDRSSNFVQIGSRLGHLDLFQFENLSLLLLFPLNKSFVFQW